MKQNKIIHILGLIGLLITTSFAHAVNFLYTAETSFFQPIPNQKYGIEVEMLSISQQKAAQILNQKLGGTIHRTDSKTLTISKSSIGNIDVKIEVNETSDDPSIDWSQNSDVVIEVVTDPILYNETLILDQALALLEKAGAKGTEKSNPVSIQVNFGMEQKNSSDEKTKEVLSILRNYFSAEHQVQIKEVLQIPQNRWAYLRDYSVGFMKRVYDPKYSPTAEEFFFDFFYRQSLEISSNGDLSVWNLPEQEVRKRIVELKYPVHVQLIKLNQLKIASLLLKWFPEDSFSKAILSHGWIKAAPLIEFRDANNDFKVAEKVRQATGIYLSSKKYGYYSHDQLMSKLSGVAENEIKELRTASQTYKNKPYGYRYFPEQHNFSDPENYLRDSVFPLYKNYPQFILGLMPPMTIGQVPLNLPGESIVWHRYQMHAANIRGKYNPALANHFLSHLMENKWFEYIFWKEFAPGSITETNLLESFDSRTAESTVKALNEKYPQGWILKGSWDWATEKNGIISSQIDPQIFYDQKALTDFLVYKKTVESTLESSDPEELFWRLKYHKGYLTWKFHELLRQPQFVLVQPLLQIAKEYRVEMLGGQALSKGTTIDRYFYEKNKGDGVASKNEALAVERFANAAVAKLPLPLQKTPMAMDVALLKNGQFEIIETNPTGNGGTLAFKPGTVQTLNEYLLSYPQSANTERANILGLSGADQMSLVEYLFKKYQIDPKVQFKGFHFFNSNLTDDRYQSTEKPIFNSGFLRETPILSKRFETPRIFQSNSRPKAGSLTCQALMSF